MNFSFGYTGNSMLFRCRASTFILSSYPKIALSDFFVTFEYKIPLSQMRSDDDKQKIEARLQQDLKSIKDGIGYANKDISDFNSRLRQTALTALEEKKKKIEQFYSITNMFEIQLEKSDFVKKHIPMQRKIVPIPKTYSSDIPTYYISDTEYKDILATIKHNCSTYERTPKTFSALKEEDLRSLLLAALNGTYQGNANGEAFRNCGKTDICIEKENRAAFVAECKMWSGPSKISEALTQLDNYLTWRDCKTALIFFVKNKDFIAVLDTVKSVLCENATIRQVKEIDRNEYDCTLISESNVGQIVKVRVLLFNLYSKDK
jgi:hypothetical protein